MTGGPNFRKLSASLLATSHQPPATSHYLRLEGHKTQEPVGKLHRALEQFFSEGEKRNVPAGHDEHQAQH